MQTDVLIIGAGHNGLTAAAYLSKAGRNVLVLERRDVVGGCAVTEEVDPELAPGYNAAHAILSWHALHRVRSPATTRTMHPTTR